MNRSIKTRIFWILFAVSVSLFAVAATGLLFFTGQNLASLEAEAARKDMQRIAATFQQRYATLSTFTADWANWDDAYDFIHHQNQEFIDSNLVDATFIDSHLNLIGFYTNQGKVAWQKLIDTHTGKELISRVFPPSGLSQDHPLRIHGTSKKGRSGLIATEAGVMMVSAHSILTSDVKGPSMGTLIMGRLIDDDFMMEISNHLLLPIDAWKKGDPSMPADVSLATTSKAVGTYLAETGLLSPRRTAYTILPDTAGRPVLMLRAQLDRRVFADSNASLYMVLSAMAVCGAIALGLMYWMLHKTVVQPLSDLKEHVIRLGKSGNLVLKSDIQRMDEIGVVATEIHHMQDRIAKLAHFDQLTGLANRALFLDRSEQAISLARRENRKIAVIFVDLDHFKEINDNFGHAVGDFVLQNVASRLETTMRKSDTICRLGGDEFAILVRAVRNREELSVICEKLHHNLVQPLAYKDEVLFPAASIGACLYPDDAQSIVALLKQADDEMYLVKQNGRNAFHVAGTLPLNNKIN